MIAALYVRAGGPYFDLPGVDPWDIERDARKYDGPHPVVAHPPCNRWCQLAFMNWKRYGSFDPLSVHAVGNDDGCFSAAYDSVLAWGGVLEHPAYSYAWRAFDLQRPRRGSWQRCPDGTWATEVSQIAYGHPARKRTWLIWNRPGSDEAPPELNWSEGEPVAQVSFCGNHGKSELPRLSKKAASSTPVAFRDLLLELALRSRP